MRLDLYQAESERIANEQMALLAEAKQRLVDNAPLSRLNRFLQWPAEMRRFDITQQP